MSNLTLFQDTLHTFSFRTANDLYVPGQNLVYSPASLTFALGLLLEGSGGLTQKQIINSLVDPRFNGGDEKAASKATDFLVELGRGHPNGIQKLLSGANFVYSNKGFKFLESYLKSIKTKYSAIAREVDFYMANEAARQTINGDVKTATKGLIPELFAEGTPGKDSQAVLVNAIYFKGLWAKKFDEKLTDEKGDFHLSNGQTINVPMMKRYNGKYELGYCPKTRARLIRLPYSSGTKDEKAYMVVVLPDDDKVKQYLANFNAADFNRAVDQAEKIKLAEVSLPRFKIASMHSTLESVLKSEGIKDVFTGEADFSRMTSNGRLSVTSVFQKAIIECNEEGTEAAAATAMVVEYMSASVYEKPLPSFIADRPFVYVLVTEKKDKLKNILFVGVVENPKKK